MQLITNPLENLLIKLRLQWTKYRLATRYFGNPIKAHSGIASLEKVRRKFMGDFSRLKVSKAGGFYYYDLNTPGFPSSAFNEYYLSELNRIYKKKDIHPLKILLMAITKKCGLACEHCFEWDRLNGKEVLTTEIIEKTIQKFQQRGVYQIQLGGGEPILRLDDIEIFVPKYKEDSDFMLVTSAYKLDEDKVKRLASSGVRGVTISIDHFNAKEHDNFRGKEGSFDWAVKAAKACVNEGMITGIAICVTRDFLNWDNLMEYADLGKELGVGFIQILEPRSVGAYSGKNVELDADQKTLLSDFFESMNYGKGFKDYPIIAYPGYHQNRVGCVGAGGRFLYIDSNGDLKVCPFCSGSFGNVTGADIQESVTEMRKKGCEAFVLSPV